MKKNGAHWEFRFLKHYNTLDGYTSFHLLPTIEFVLDKMFDDEQSFDIRFEWLFWSFMIIRAWGSVYTPHN